MSANQNTGKDFKDLESQETVLQLRKKIARGRWRCLNLLLMAQRRLILVSVAHRSSKRSNMSANQNTGKDFKDLESQETVLQLRKKIARGRWRCLNLLLMAQRRLILVSVAHRSSNDDRQLINNALSPDYCRGSQTTITTSTDVALNVYSAEDINVSDPHVVQFISINKIIKDKDYVSLYEFGGASGVAEAFGTDLETGIPREDQHCCCRRIACTSFNSEAPKKGFFRRLQGSSNNYIILLLLLSAVLSIGFGIKEEGLKTGWVEGVIILIAIGILVVFPLIRDLLMKNSSRLPDGNQELMEERYMWFDVVRGGNIERIFISDILLGDIVCLNRGDQIPGDGLLISGDFLKLDDGSKAVTNGSYPFLFYGSEVIDGNGRMLITSVKEDTKLAMTMSMITRFNRAETFGSQLDKINTWKQIVGVIISIFIIIALFLRFELAKEQVDSGTPDIKGKPIAVDEFRNMVQKIAMKPSGKISTFTTSLTIFLVGLVEGLPLCITLAVAHWKRQGIAFAQDLSACVAAGSVTAICTDKIGGLTLEPLEVDKVWIGEDEITEDSVIASHVCETLCEGISTSILIPHALHTAVEEPLLSWAALKFCIKLETMRQCTAVLEVEELIDEEGRGLLIKKENNGGADTMCLHFRGLATKILPKCSCYYDNEGTLKDINEQKREAFEQIVEQMQSTHLNKVIAFAYKQTEVPTIEETGLVLLGLVGLKVSIREDIKNTIQACRNAGVRIILVSVDNVANLETIARDIDIPVENPNGQKVIITGEDFCNLTDEEKKEMAKQISGMGNSLPSDKCLLISYLKRNEDSVAVIGIGTNDVPALQAADVGLAMGSCSTTTAQASADIIIWATNISFLVNLFRYGRCIYNNIQKYIQLELTMLVSGLLISSITVASTGNMPITTIESSWVNLVVPLLGGLALLTEPLSEKSMETPPKRNEAVITKTMWTNIFSQAIYQTTILVTFQFKGQEIPGINEKVKKTIIFNSFVLCQLCNKFNSRELRLKNKFRAIHKNHWLWVALGVTVALQEIFIEIAHILAGNARLNWTQWCICFVIGTLSLIIDWAEKLVLGFLEE